MDMLHIDGLKKCFGDKVVLNGLDLSVPEHSIFGFIGKNGAGKTTTMKTILGLLRADCGEITVAGEKVVYGQTVTNRHIGYLPDVPEFYPFMTAAEYLYFCGEITGIDKMEIKRRSAELLDMVGLGDEKHRIKGFSRGMKQRLGIAQALLNRPKLLICDEPTSALDPVGRKEILELLLAVREQTTILFSTHILSDVERICTDVAFLHDGVVSIQGKLSDMKSTYRDEGYLLETETEADVQMLKQNFCGMKRIGRNQLSFNSRRIQGKQTGTYLIDENEYNLYEVLQFVTDKKISLLKLERMEPTLESLFMEVVER